MTQSSSCRHHRQLASRLIKACFEFYAGIIVYTFFFLYLRIFSKCNICKIHSSSCLYLQFLFTRFDFLALYYCLKRTCLKCYFLGPTTFSAELAIVILEHSQALARRLLLLWHNLVTFLFSFTSIFSQRVAFVILNKHKLFMAILYCVHSAKFLSFFFGSFIMNHCSRY